MMATLGDTIREGGTKKKWEWPVLIIPNEALGETIKFSWLLKDSEYYQVLIFLGQNYILQTRKKLENYLRKLEIFWVFSNLCLWAQFFWDSRLPD